MSRGPQPTAIELSDKQKSILEQIKDKLKEEGLTPLFYLKNKKGDKLPFGNLKIDIHELVINRKKDIHRLINKLLPLSKHSEKTRKMKFILENKNKTWGEIEPSWNKLFI